jgi:acid stress-induced BolA-like protein IbaG/YrbA
MRTIAVPPQAEDVNALLRQASHEDILVRAADGTHYMLTAVSDFDEEIVNTRRNAKLMALLDDRAKQADTVPLEEVKRRLDLGQP